MMKVTKMLAFCGMATLAFSGCQKQEEVAVKQDISAITAGQVKSLGFTTQDMKAVQGGVVVEGDIFLSNEMLSSKSGSSFLRVGDDEQYRTTNLVTGLPRVLTVSLSSQFPAVYTTAITEAIRRYNAANLQLTFQLVTSGTANIPVTYAADLGPGVLGQSGGFPDAAGNPAPGFKLVPNVIGNQTYQAIATIMAHEMGHCIGFRHTDYYNRQYSCGGRKSNEGASTVGAILIPGTPSQADPNSWMLACVGNNVDRPFNANDVTALNYLY